jgi:tetratricopeptide (TPR) repeat protein
MATLGYILMNLGEFAAAQTYLDKACLIQEEKLGRQHLQTVRAMTHRGNWLFHMGKIEAAQTLLTQVLAVQETIKPIHGQAADILNLLGEIYTQQGALAEARPFLEKSRHIWRQLQKGDTLEIAHLFILLGEWHQASGEVGEARSFYEQALAILEKSALPTHNDIRRVENNLAMVTANRTHLS